MNERTHNIIGLGFVAFLGTFCIPLMANAATFGHTEICSAGDDNSPTGFILAGGAITLSGSASVVTSMSFYATTHTGTPDLVMGIYSNNAGHPGILIMQTAAVSINASNQWFTANISGTHSLSAGSYFLGWQDSGTVHFNDCADSGKILPYKVNVYSGTMPDPYETELGHSTDLVANIYVTYTPVSGGSSASSTSAGSGAWASFHSSYSGSLVIGQDIPIGHMECTAYSRPSGSGNTTVCSNWSIFALSDDVNGIMQAGDIMEWKLILWLGLLISVTIIVICVILYLISLIWPKRRRRVSHIKIEDIP